MNTVNIANNHLDELSEIRSRVSSLREVTYSYLPLGNDAYLNETIFIQYAGFRLEEVNKLSQEVLAKIIFQTRSKLEKDIEALKKIRSNVPENQSQGVDILITALEFTDNGLEFELELAGYEHGLNSEEVQSKVTRQEALDKKLFGEHISQNTEFITESIAYITWLLKEQKGLSKEKVAIIQTFIQKLLDQHYTLTGKSISISEIPKYSAPKRDEKYLELSKIKISRRDYMRIFDIFFEISHVPQRSQKGNFSSFYDGDEYYGVPNNDGYAEKTLAELLKLLPHETGHYVNLLETENRGDGKYAGDMIKEEGVAKLTEELVQGSDICSMSFMTFAAPAVIANKLYDGEEYEEFHDAYLELLELTGQSSKGDVRSKTLRKKRGFPKKLPGGTNKDATYSLGLQQVLKYMRTGEGDVQNLFGGKISIEQMQSGEFAPEDFSNKTLYHIILAELIIYYLKYKDIKAQGSIHEDFVVYLKNKYAFLTNQFDLFSKAEMFSFATRRKVVEILKIIEKSQ